MPRALERQRIRPRIIRRRSMTRSRHACSIFAVVILWGVARAGADPVFSVNTTIDGAGGADLTDGVCETGPGNGFCTLRAAVDEANNANANATIVVPPGLYPLSLGYLPLYKSMTIEGAGPGVTVLDALATSSGIFAASGAIQLRGLEIRNGRAIGSSGGGIYNTSALTLENVAVIDCAAGDGGGIDNQGILVMRNGMLHHNEATDAGAGLYNVGSARIEDSSIRYNDAEGGGGILNEGDLWLDRTLIASNSANVGGGLYAADLGAAIALNTTIFDNGAFVGGGLYARGTARLYHVTITGNRAVEGAFTPAAVGGIRVESGTGALVTLRNSLVIGNLRSGVSDDCSNTETIVSDGYNLIGNRAECPLVGDLTGVNGTDRNFFTISDLAPHGGFAPDLIFTGGSTPIPVERCTDSLGARLYVDQRGYARDGPCDIGAYEASGRHVPDAWLGVELIRNGGAEGFEIGRADGFAIEQPPFWAQTQAPMTQIAYGLPGGFPLATSAPDGSGRLFFEGGDQPAAGGMQQIDVSAIAAAIDAGGVPFRVAGAFGGYQTEDDHAVLVVAFRDAAGVIDSLSIGGFSASDRNGETGLLPDAASGVVPAGTRAIDVELVMTRTDGVRNNGYADQISLVLPEPTAALSATVALAVLLGLRVALKRVG
jgi:CSLREA domain-containing protein